MRHKLNFTLYLTNIAPGLRKNRKRVCSLPATKWKIRERITLCHNEIKMAYITVAGDKTNCRSLVRCMSSIVRVKPVNNVQSSFSVDASLVRDHAGPFASSSSTYLVLLVTDELRWFREHLHRTLSIHG